MVQGISNKCYVPDWFVKDRCGDFGLARSVGRCIISAVTDIYCKPCAKYLKIFNQMISMVYSWCIKLNLGQMCIILKLFNDFNSLQYDTKVYHLFNLIHFLFAVLSSIWHGCCKLIILFCFGTIVAGVWIRQKDGIKIAWKKYFKKS